MRDSSYEEIEHTADWAIRVRGRDLAELFAAAARGMFSLLTDLSAVEARREIELDLRAIDTETLLVDWLNELLYLSEQRQIVFNEFEIIQLDEPEAGRIERVARLRARVAGGPVPGGLRKVIKAATFSSLAIDRDAAAYSTEIVFDV